MAQLCLAWVLRQDNVAAAIVGASRPEQVHENARAADVRAERRHAARDRRGAAAVAISRLAVDPPRTAHDVAVCRLGTRGGAVRAAAARCASRRRARRWRARARRSPPRASGAAGAGRCPRAPPAGTRRRPSRAALRASACGVGDLDEVADRRGSPPRARARRSDGGRRPWGWWRRRRSAGAAQAQAQERLLARARAQQVHRHAHVRLEEAVAIERRLAGALDAAQDHRLHGPTVAPRPCARSRRTGRPSAAQHAASAARSGRRRR